MQKQSFHNYPESSQREPCLEFLIHLIASNEIFLIKNDFSEFSLSFQNQYRGWWLRLGTLELHCLNHEPHVAAEHLNCTQV